MIDGHAILLSVLGLILLWVGVFYLWQDFRHDAFREDIFSLRDEMFLYAAHGNIAFNHPAYTLMRTRMNALLRHGHDLTLFRMGILAVTHKEDPGTSARLEEAIAQLPSSIQKTMRMYNVRVLIFVLQHVLYSSFLRYIAFRPFMRGVKIHDVIGTPVVAREVEKLESETIAEDEDMKMVCLAS